jgi:two-component system, LytTR family, response regulator
MNCIIIDDEPLAREGMKMHIDNMPNLKLLGSFSSPFDATELIQQGNIDLIFLDINMPEINGLNFVQSLLHPPLIIFATAYPQYALDSYELDSVDYLIKPIRFERFVKAVHKVENYLSLLQSKEINKIEVEDIAESFIYVKTDKKYFKIEFNDILYIEGLRDYVAIHTKEKKIIASMNVKTIYDKLPGKTFARISKSYIVNTVHIIYFDSYNVYVQHAELPIGTNFKDDFIKNYIEGKVVRR